MGFIQPAPEHRRKEEAAKLYLWASSLFIAALVVCNLIANKFVRIDLGFKEFVVSAGILPYPLTFLMTDVLSEIYGARKTNRVVLAGFGASLFVLLVLWLGSAFPAIEGSPVGDSVYDQVFRNAWRVLGASMAAYLAAQLVDVRLFHFWKRLTRGRHLWLRNNFSTILSQWVDTVLVVGVLFVGTKTIAEMGQLILDGWLFKVLMALLDTALIYPLVSFIRLRLDLKPGEEWSDE
ncbi:queuosine precursor transporter [bacterium]|nr:queuosine precursor transporter [bacterium]